MGRAPPQRSSATPAPLRGISMHARWRCRGCIVPSSRSATRPPQVKLIFKKIPSWEGARVGSVRRCAA
eukprot:1856083-Pyramimonas_sp.AAC.1